MPDRNWLVDELFRKEYFRNHLINCDGKDVSFLERKDFVYKITCNTTQRSYIGRSVNPKYRIRQHYEALKNHRHKMENFQEDFDLYGPDDFYFQILGEDLPNSKFEKKMQEKYKSYLWDFGYNIKDQNFYNRKGELRCQKFTV